MRYVFSHIQPLFINTCVMCQALYEVLSQCVGDSEASYELAESLENKTKSEIDCLKSSLEQSRKSTDLSWRVSWSPGCAALPAVSESLDRRLWEAARPDCDGAWFLFVALFVLFLPSSCRWNPGEAPCLSLPLEGDGKKGRGGGRISQGQAFCCLLFIACWLGDIVAMPANQICQMMKVREGEPIRQIRKSKVILVAYFKSLWMVRKVISCKLSSLDQVAINLSPNQ